MVVVQFFPHFLFSLFPSFFFSYFDVILKLWNDIRKSNICAWSLTRFIAYVILILNNILHVKFHIHACVLFLLFFLCLCPYIIKKFVTSKFKLCNFDLFRNFLLTTYIKYYQNKLELKWDFIYNFVIPNYSYHISMYYSRYIDIEGNNYTILLPNHLSLDRTSMKAKLKDNIYLHLK